MPQTTYAALKALLRFATNDNTDNGFSSVHVCPEGLIATNGHNLLRMPWEHSVAASDPALVTPRNLSAADLRAMLKATATHLKAQPVFYINTDAYAAPALETGEYISSFQPKQGTLKHAIRHVECRALNKWRTVVKDPSTPDRYVLSIGRPYLEMILEAARDLGVEALDMSVSPDAMEQICFAPTQKSCFDRRFPEDAPLALCMPIAAQAEQPIIRRKGRLAAAAAALLELATEAVAYLGDGNDDARALSIRIAALLATIDPKKE